MHMHHPNIASRWEHKYGSKPMGGNDMPPGIGYGRKGQAFMAAMERFRQNGRPQGRRGMPGSRRTPPILNREGQVGLSRPRPMPTGNLPPGAGRPRDMGPNRPPNRPGLPPGAGQPRPNSPLVGVRNLQTLRDNNPRNDVRGLLPLIRMFRRASMGLYG
jgi:hypothetical protein